MALGKLIGKIFLNSILAASVGYAIYQVTKDSLPEAVEPEVNNKESSEDIPTNSKSYFINSEEYRKDNSIEDEESEEDDEDYDYEEDEDDEEEDYDDYESDIFYHNDDEDEEKEELEQFTEFVEFASTVSDLMSSGLL